MNASCKRLDVDGVSLALDDTGPADGPALLCLHAIGHDAGDFAHLATRLGDRYRVLALDWPGQGRSGPDGQPATAARYEALARGVLDALGVRDVVLIGNSIGGAAALRLAVSDAARVRGLVLANPGGLDGGWFARLVCRWMVRFFSAGARRARWYPRWFARYYGAVLSGPGPAASAVRERIIADAYAVAPLLAQAWAGFASPAADLRALPAQVACPTLLTWATGDRFVQLGRAMKAIERFPRAELERFACGHAPQLELPEAFAERLERYLATLPLQPGMGAVTGATG